MMFLYMVPAVFKLFIYEFHCSS